MASSSAHGVNEALVHLFQDIHDILDNDLDCHEEAYAILRRAKDELYASKKIKNWGLNLGPDPGLDVHHPIDLTDSEPELVLDIEESENVEIPMLEQKGKKARHDKTSKDKEGLFVVACGLAKWILKFTVNSDTEHEFRDLCIRKGS